MDRDGTLRLDLFDVYGKRLREKVEINLRHQTLSDNPVISANAANRIAIKNLFGAPQGLYKVEVDPPAYLPVSLFVNLKASGITDLPMTFPVDPKKVKKVNFPDYQKLNSQLQTLLENSDAVFSFEGKKGEELYQHLDDIRKAGMLNIVAKTRSTPLTNGTIVFPYINRLVELRGDRFFAFVQKELREEVKNSAAEGLFHPVNSILHHLPDQFSGTGFSEAGSFKTEDAYGNLHLTFYMKGHHCLADIDIDDAAGLEHVFQVARNCLNGRPTHPYDIHEILVYHQKLDPEYSFEV
jgi:hypothetical protein